MQYAQLYSELRTVICGLASQLWMPGRTAGIVESCFTKFASSPLWWVSDEQHVTNTRGLVRDRLDC
eukprot:908398-Pelagomonas_calceolata.AAC.5